MKKISIEKVQWEAARIVTEATNSCNRINLLEDTGWDTMEKRRYKHRMITFFQNGKRYGPSFLQALVPPSVHQASQRNLRNFSNLTIPRSRTNLYEKSFIPLATREWNLLPENMKLRNSLASLISARPKLEWGCPNGTKYPPRQPIPNRAILPNRARVYRRTDGRTDGQGDSRIPPLTSLRGV